MDYFSGERNLFCKVKIIVSSFFDFLLCASSFRFPMQKQKQGPVVEAVRFSISGLKALICSEEDQEEGEEKEDRVVRSAGVGIIRSKLLTHSSSFCSIRSYNLLMDDLIGAESGFCLTSNTEEIEEKLTRSDSEHYLNRINNRRDFTQQNQRRAPKKQFPPPIPFLAAQSGNRTRPPWILTRSCTDGRLILKLERVRYHQSLESHRENGRLILNFVPAQVAGCTEDDYHEDLQFIEEDDEGKEEIESIECEEGIDPEIAFKSFTYGGEGVGGGMFCDREPFWDVNGNFEERHVVHGHFGSAPLRPMGTVM